MADSRTNRPGKGIHRGGIHKGGIHEKAACLPPSLKIITGKRLLFLKYLLGSYRNVLQEPRGSYRNIVLKILLNVSVR